MNVLNSLAGFDWMVAFGALLIACSVYIFASMSLNRHSSFDFAQMFEGDNGRTSLARFLAFVGGLTATWIVVAYATTKELTDMMFSLYLGILVAGKVASEYVAAKRSADEARADPAPDTSQPAGQVDITVPLSVKQSDVTVSPSAERKVPLGKPKR